MKDKQKLILELEELNILEVKLENYINQLRADQANVRTTLEQLTTWKSGNSKKHIMTQLDYYFQAFSNKINHFEELLSSIKSNQKSVQYLISTMELPTGPLW